MPTAGWVHTPAGYSPLVYKHIVNKAKVRQTGRKSSYDMKTGVIKARVCPLSNYSLDLEKIGVWDGVAV